MKTREHERLVDESSASLFVFWEAAPLLLSHDILPEALLIWLL